MTWCQGISARPIVAASVRQDLHDWWQDEEDCRYRRGRFWTCRRAPPARVRASRHAPRGLFTTRRDDPDYSPRWFSSRAWTGFLHLGKTRSAATRKAIRSRVATHSNQRRISSQFHRTKRATACRAGRVSVARAVASVAVSDERYL